MKQGSMAASVAAFLLMLVSSQAGADIPSSVTQCAAGDSRVPVKLWQPDVRERTLSSAPDAKDGDVFYIELHAENAHAGCGSAAPDHMYTFDVPDPEGGGLAVNFRGNVQFANGYCYVAGFFMNEQVHGMHQGWTETYFRPLDKAEVITSGRFCSAAL